MNPENSTQIYHHPIPHTWIFYHEFHQERVSLMTLKSYFITKTITLLGSWTESIKMVYGHISEYLVMVPFVTVSNVCKMIKKLKIKELRIFIHLIEFLKIKTKFRVQIMTWLVTWLWNPVQNWLVKNSLIFILEHYNFTACIKWN